MASRDKRLEQAKPGKKTPVKQWERKRDPPGKFGKTGKRGSKHLPSGTIAQHRAKPGMTSSQ